MIDPQPQSMRRIGVIDLMLIMTAVAFTSMLQNATRFGEDSLPTWLFYSYLFGSGMMMGVALPAIYWIPVHYSRTGKLFSQPGHWILGIHLVTAIFSIGFHLVYQLAGMEEAFSFAIGATINSIAAFLQLGAAIMSIIAAVFVKEARWKISLGLLSLYFAGSGLQMAFFAIVGFGGFSSFFDWMTYVGIPMQIAGVVTLIAIIVAVLIDLIRKASRDWLHWVGLLTIFVALVVFPILDLLVSQFANLNN